MTYNDLAELFKREGGDAQVCFSVISQNKILFGNNDTNKYIISFTNEEPIKWVKEVQEEPVSEELEDFALQYAGHHAPYDDCMQEVVDAVKVGAQWQKNQTMKDAVDGVIADRWADQKLSIDIQLVDTYSYNLYDKVKLIIIKQKEE